ncbi:hypothetical protein A2U01_0107711, partial [Trifolium medium]|nr:hypothetical protein [Trifolium medium]
FTDLDSPPLPSYICINVPD